ncbi:lipase family protein [Photobacterium sp. DA100]|uniref:lipase family protein n=1 Tax=Photobacterium sp. DA100 TaxID=3027472 RepID=UPI002478715D|nr:lipase family protein [Photobacterium sp. DA100]WEM41544.1 lipase family protein [Photobacterium sp. DA100]
MEAITQERKSTGLATKMLTYCWWKAIGKIDTSKDNLIDTLDSSKVCVFLGTVSSGLKEIHTLPKALGDNPIEPFYGEDSELNRKNYPNTASYLITLLKAAFDLSPFMIQKKIKCLSEQNYRDDNPNPTPNEKWFFINGICTSKDMAKENARMLSKVFGRPITPLHNPTNGMLPDIFEAITGRDFDKYTNIARTAKNLIWDELQQLKVHTIDKNTDTNHHHKIVVIGHSQGGIILSNVVGKLILEHHKDPLLNHLEVYTFASAHDEYPSFGNQKGPSNYLSPFTEHFANDGDFVARLGVLHETDKTKGNVFEKKGSGHLLNYHYLRDFLAGKYDVTQPSHLSTLRNGKR